MSRVRYTFMVEYEVDPKRITEQAVAVATGAYPYMEKHHVADGIKPRRAVLVKTEELLDRGGEEPMASAMPPEHARTVRVRE